LARLRLEGLVTTRREGKAIFYTLRDRRTVELLACLPKLFK
jgi:ArsR family transcriptional regulator